MKERISLSREYLKTRFTTRKSEEYKNIEDEEFHNIQHHSTKRNLEWP